MEPTIRAYDPSDRAAVVALALRAWEPVFSSMREILGPDVDDVVHAPDWRTYQSRSVEAALDDANLRTWVAEIATKVVGFVAVSLDAAQQVGEVWMVAVDPDVQNAGLGTVLTQKGIDEIRAGGMRVAMIGTGGDPGHAPARRVYEKLGFAPMPIVQYYKAL